MSLVGHELQRPIHTDKVVTGHIFSLVTVPHILIIVYKVRNFPGWFIGQLHSVVYKLVGVVFWHCPLDHRTMLRLPNKTQ